MGRIDLRGLVATCRSRLVWGVRSGLNSCLSHLGTAGVCSVLFAMAAVPAWWALHQQRRALGQMQMVFASKKGLDGVNAARNSSLSGMRTLDGRGRLDAFEKILLPHEDIPVLVQDILQLAENQGLLVQRGEYRPQADAAGNFLRYGMSLPVKGDAAAINRFIQAALRTHQALILESVRFKREQIGAHEIEARVQWAVLARLPVDVVSARSQ
jgi:hypothetical protein